MGLTRRMVVAVFAITLALPGCEGMTREEKQMLGGAAGAIVGGVLGSQVGEGTGQIVATAVGSLVGAGVGYLIARELTKEQEEEVQSVVENTLSSDPNEPARETWQSQTGDKQVAVITSPAFKDDQTDKVARSKNVEIDRSKIPEDAICRYNTNQLSVEDEPKVEERAIYCRTEDARWVRVGESSQSLS